MSHRHAAIDQEWRAVRAADPADAAVDGQPVAGLDLLHGARIRPPGDASEAAARLAPDVPVRIVAPGETIDVPAR